MACGSQETSIMNAEDPRSPEGAPHGEAVPSGTEALREKPVYAYCLFCRTNRCDAIARQLQLRGVDKAFSPKRLSRQHKQGKNEDRPYDLLPGYVFVYLRQQPESFAFLSGIDGIIRRLGREQGTAGLDREDYDFAMRLYRKDGLLGTVSVIKEGSRVRIDDPLFAGYRGEVAKLDHRKKRALIRFRFDQREWSVWFACDIVYIDELDELNETPALIRAGRKNGNV